jgi:hypothetical protein
LSSQEKALKKAMQRLIFFAWLFTLLFSCYSFISVQPRK